MRVVNLASGSKGNSTYIGHGVDNLLVDIGLSCMELEKRLKLINVNPECITAILLTHNHIDHIKGVVRFANKYNIKVYAHRECFEDVDLSNLEKKLIQIIGLEDFELGTIKVSSFELPHDALKTIGFNFYCDGNKVSLLTDVGEVNDCVFHKLEGSNLVLIESNYDEQMLMNGPYPLSLKKRIKSNMGHLSNCDCANIVVRLSKLGTKFFMLMHISENNNTPEIAYNNIMNVLYDGYGGECETRVFLSHQERPSVNFTLKSRIKGE